MQGSTGFTGEQGSRGDTGYRGEKGAHGVSGEIGATGQRGDTGLHGPQGPQGPQGQAGEKGEKGVAGNSGKDGQNGATGAKGERGFTGLDGSRGEQGSTGFTGARGAIGEIGATGNRGSYGEGTFTLKANPLNGINIIEILNSSTITKTSGEPGWNANVYSLQAYMSFNFSFSVTSNNPNIFAGLSSFPSLNKYTSNIDYGFNINDDRSIYIYEKDNIVKICHGEFTEETVFGIQYTGLSMNYLIDGFVVHSNVIDLITPLHANFLLYNSGFFIKNIHFEQLAYIVSANHLVRNNIQVDSIGITGSTGQSGQSGDTGIQGETGLPGVTGQQGGTGYTGQKGDQGLQGKSGLAGATGEQGETGYTGAQGSTGSYTGPTGATGSTGDTGPTGDRGPTGDTGHTGLLNLHTMITIDLSGNLYVPDTGNNCIKMVTQDGIVSTIAGVPGVAGNIDGPGSIARFNHPQGIAIDSSGILYISDTDNNSIRMITPDLNVRTLYPTMDSTDRLNRPTGIDIDNDGNIYIADTSNNLIRILYKNGELKTIIGFIENGYADGTSDYARFYYPSGIKVKANGNILVSDQYNSVIREISLISIDNRLLLDNNIVSRGQQEVSFNYADIALTPVYSSQNLNVSRSPNYSGILGPTLSRDPASQAPSIQGHQRGKR